MSNMSYCRFENTSLDLEDCLNAIREDNYTEDEPISSREAQALQNLLEQAEELIDLSHEIELILDNKSRY
tara:strand:- start:312 stop:521 length:210 start_codon:yes stop_codon:yes gene_type:complete